MRIRRVGTMALAVGADRILAVGGASTPDHAVEIRKWKYGSAPDGTSRSLEDTLREALEVCRKEFDPFASIAVALLPDVSDVRCIALPPLREADLRRHLRQRGHRYVPSSPKNWLAAAAAPDRSAPRRWIGFADAPAVETVHRVAHELGVGVRCVAPAAVVWVAFLDAQRPHQGRPTALIVEAPVVSGTDALHAIWRDPTGILHYRKFPSTDVGLEALTVALPEGLDVRLSASPDRVEPLNRRLERFGLRATVLGDPGASDPSLIAAHRVREEPSDWMVPDNVTRGRTTRRRRKIAGLVAASVVILAASAGITLWGLERELSALSQERAAIGPVVAQALEVQERVDRLEASLSELDRLTTEPPRWSTTIAELSTTLPHSAYLTGFRAAADSLQVDAVASDAAEVFQALAGARGIADLRPVSAVRREALENEGMVEHVTLAGRVLSRAREHRP